MSRQSLTFAFDGLLPSNLRDLVLGIDEVEEWLPDESPGFRRRIGQSIGLLEQLEEVTLHPHGLADGFGSIRKHVGFLHKLVVSGESLDFSSALELDRDVSALVTTHGRPNHSERLSPTGRDHALV